ncbi:MAG: xanthine dehydrogenase family protein molybdopterin-binding subunit [Rhodospirillaceae bacterium]
MSTIGTSVPRFEDHRLLIGNGRYTDDILSGSEAWMVLVRSPFAAADILSIDCSQAKVASGVLHVFTRSDLDADGIGLFNTEFPYKRGDGQDMYRPPFGMLAGGTVNYVGDPIVAVIAETRYQAEDAAELVIIEFEERASVTDARKALAKEAPQVWPQAPGNVAFIVERGNQSATETAFANAAHVTALDLNITRVTANSIEPRSALGIYDSVSGGLTLYSGTQTPHRLRATLCNDILHIPLESLRVVAPDIGGAFGMKNAPYPEHALVLWAARKLGRAVFWRSSRIEAMQSDLQGRDNFFQAELAIDDKGHFLALRVESIGNLGAYLSMLTPHPPTANVGGMIGPYAIGAAFINIKGVHTNTLPTAPYRGAGRPEATYVIERLVDAAAQELGIDSIELRQKNMLTADQLPHETPLGMVYDCGDFPSLLMKSVKQADWNGFENRRKDSERRGLLRGRGLAYAIEIAAGPQSGHMPESMDIRLERDGQVIVRAGSVEIGTGHATAYRQILDNYFGLDPQRVTILNGDTGTVDRGVGSFGSRTMAAGGQALVSAGNKLVAKGKPLAAKALEVAEADVEFTNGAFRVVGTDYAISLHQLASHDDYGLTLSAEVTKKTDGPTYPNGCHVCEVEIDAMTGIVRIERYLVVDDVGTVINPMLMKGQIHGGIAQGAGQALMEEIVFDDCNGQLISGSLLDYTLPRADDLPLFTVESHPIPTQLNPTGAKGAGEAGTVGSLPVVIIAALDALRPLGIRQIDMPLTPEHVWRALQTQKEI